MGRENWETKPDGRQIGRQDRRQAQRGGHSTPAKVKERQIGRQAQRGGHSTPAKVKDKARWETNWETSPARRTQHPSQGERQSQMGDPFKDKLTSPTRRTQHPSQGERQSQMGTEPDGRQIQTTHWETRPETSPARRTQHPSQGERQSRCGTNGETKLGDKARWQTNWETRPKTSPAKNWETKPDGRQIGRQDRTSPARRTQHPSQGERQSQTGNKCGDKTGWETKPDGRQIGRQAQRGGHSTPAKADTLKTALRTPTVNCLGKNLIGWPLHYWWPAFWETMVTSEILSEQDVPHISVHKHADVRKSPPTGI